MGKIYVEGIALYNFREFQAVPETALELTLTKEGKGYNIKIKLEGKHYNPFEMYNKTRTVNVRATREQAREFVRAYIKASRLMRVERVEQSAKNFFLAQWERERDNSHGFSNSAQGWAEVYGYELGGGTPSSCELTLHRNPEGNVYFEYTLPGETLVTHTVILEGDMPTVYHCGTVEKKGFRRVQAESCGDSPYYETRRESNITWREALALYEGEMHRRQEKAEAEAKAKAYQEEVKNYRDMWKEWDGSKIRKGYKISFQYTSDPYVVDEYGNLCFSIPRSIKSYRELMDKLDKLLDEYYQECE